MIEVLTFIAGFMIGYLLIPRLVDLLEDWWDSRR